MDERWRSRYSTSSPYFAKWIEASDSLRFFAPSQGENAAAGAGHLDGVSRRKRPRLSLEVKLEPPLEEQRRAGQVAAAPHHQRPGPEQRSWTIKYRPRTIGALAGNQQSVARLLEWLETWDQGPPRPQCTKHGGLLISGPPGVGKTVAVAIVSRELGFQSVLASANGKKDPKAGNQVLNVKNHRHLALTRKVLLIVDDADGLDESGCLACLDLLKQSQHPVIIICNDRYCKGLRSIRRHCVELKFQKPRKAEVLKFLADVAREEKLLANETLLTTLVEAAQCDIRQALNQLQYFGGHRRSSCQELRVKDIFYNPFAAVDNMFGQRSGLCLEVQMHQILQDVDFVFLLVQENYVNYKPSMQSRVSNTDAMSRAAEYLCFGDILQKHMYEYHHWELTQLFSVLLALICSSLLQGPRQSFTTGNCHLRFPEWLTKASAAKSQKPVSTSHRLGRSMLLDLFPSLSVQARALNTVKKTGYAGAAVQERQLVKVASEEQALFGLLKRR